MTVNNKKQNYKANLAGYLKVFYNIYLQYIFLTIFALLLLLQIFFGQKFYHHRFKQQIVPVPPTQLFTKIVAFGDRQFLFRLLATRLQNTGDVFAGFLPLKQYDYRRIYDWLKILDFLDHKSNFAPSLASYYFSGTQNNGDKYYIVDYLEEYSNLNFSKSWWWLFQAVDISLRIPDTKRAIKIAEKIENGQFIDSPLWVKLVATKLKIQNGNKDSRCLSFNIISNLIDSEQKNNHKLNSKELDFMKGYVKQSLDSFKKQGFDPRKCQ